MVLQHGELPGQFSAFQLLREGILDNRDMAEQGFGKRNADGLRAIGRITGYMREFATTGDPEMLEPGTELAVATVVHLFDHGDAVSRWIADVFLRDFEESVGREMAMGQQVVSADRLQPEGLSDEAAGIRVLQRGTHGLVSSTVVDFRVGRLLGVTFCVTLGDAVRTAEVEELARNLERKMVQVVLGAD